MQAKRLEELCALREASANGEVDLAADLVDRLPGGADLADFWATCLPTLLRLCFGSERRSRVYRRL